jgi:cation diffusion facilitator family transporter
MPAESKTAVIAALAGDVAVAVTKFVAAGISGSSAMFSEGIHSLVDSADGALLLFGMARSTRPADEDHPLGHAHELYFWSFVVAVMIFGLGGGVTIYEGILKIRQPGALENPLWDYVVLAVAAVLQAVSMVVGYRQFRKQIGNAPLILAIHRSKDPSVFTVVIEDAIGIAGIIVAFAGVYLSHAAGDARFDGAASILIGLMLAATALVIGNEIRGLLIGESADPEMVREIRRLAEADPAVDRANPPIAVQLGPDSVLLLLEIQFSSRASAGEVAEAVDRMEHAIHTRFPVVQQIYIEAESIKQGALTSKP